MSTSRKVERVVFFCDGTISTRNALPNSFLGRLASNIMYHPNNSIGLLYENCEETHKFYFEGPGADLCSDKSPHGTLKKIVNTIGGTIHGDVGVHGIETTLGEVKAILLNLQKAARQDDVSFEVHVISWSRGGFLAWKIKKLIADLLDEKLVDISALHLMNIDPVAGGPFDRFNLWMKSHKKDPNIPIHSITYFSDSGNLKYWPFQFNTIFFSGFLLDEDHPNAERYLIRVHHEGIVGRSFDEEDNHPDRLAGDAVLGDIVKKSPLTFNATWTQQVIAAGERACKETLKQNLTPQMTRAYLSPKTTRTCFIGVKEDIAHFASRLQVERDDEASNEINAGDIRTKKRAGR